MLLAPIIWVLTGGIVYFFAAKTWWFPPPINQHGMDYDAQFMRTLIVVGVVFTLAQFAFEASGPLNARSSCNSVAIWRSM